MVDRSRARSKQRVGLGRVGWKIMLFLSVQTTHQMAERRDREEALFLKSLISSNLDHRSSTSSWGTKRASSPSTLRKKSRQIHACIVGGHSFQDGRHRRHMVEAGATQVCEVYLRWGFFFEEAVIKKL